MNRRDLIKDLALASLAIAIPSQLFAGKNESLDKKSKKVFLKKGDCILFYGDSITDGNRNKENKAPSKPHAIGGGYAMSVSATLAMKYPNMGFTFYNRGINGNKTAQMIQRLEEDCINLKPTPTVISLLTGINDYSASYAQTGKGDPEKYEKDLRELLTKITTQLPNVRLIVMEPYVIKGIRDKIDAFLPDFYSYQPIARKIAEEFNAVFIPLQALFDEAIKKSSLKRFSADGVHPASAGIELISSSWLNVVEVGEP